MTEFPTKITGDRVYIENIKPTFERAQEMYDLVDKNREHLLPWLGWAAKENADITTTCPEDSYNFLSRSYAAWCSGEKFEALLFDAKTDKIIGGIGAHQFDKQHKKIEIGFWLAKEYTGQGLMNEAVLIFEKALFNYGLNRIVITNDLDNVASANVAKKAGYTHEGISRHGYWTSYLKEFRSHNVFSKIKGE